MSWGVTARATPPLFFFAPSNKQTKKACEDRMPSSLLLLGLLSASFIYFYIPYSAPPGPSEHPSAANSRENGRQNAPHYGCVFVCLFVFRFVSCSGCCCLSDHTCAFARPSYLRDNSRRHSLFYPRTPRVVFATSFKQRACE